ncbi:MAG: hypothetical protein O3C21_00985 [Verrucomicrobia bacterium]|nr:hypothetical protein [Verrucomicrobiota bacterium]
MIFPEIRRSNVMLAIICMQCAIAAALPTLQSDDSDAQADHQPATQGFAWPRTFEGAALAPVELDAKAKAALHRFPGDVALFTDGERYVLLRHVTRATRQLHSSADCLQGMGHQIRSRDIITRGEDDNHDSQWARFTTDTGIEAFEQIRCQRNHQTWTDVSAWFWDATFHSEDGPWLAVTVFDADFRGRADESK